MRQPQFPDEILKTPQYCQWDQILDFLRHQGTYSKIKEERLDYTHPIHISAALLALKESIGSLPVYLANKNSDLDYAHKGIMEGLEDLIGQLDTYAEELNDELSGKADYERAEAANDRFLETIYSRG